MRIVHVKDYCPPMLLSYQERLLAREHAKLGHEVHIVTSDRYNPIIYPAAEPLLGNRIIGTGFSIEEGVKTWRLKTLLELPHAIWMLGLERKIRELKPDIVIVHSIASFHAIKIARLKKKLDNFKLIYDDHMTFDNSRSKLRMLYPLFKWTFSRLIQETADALVGIAEACKVFMNKKYGFPLERIIVIPLGADDGLFKFDATTRHEIRSQLSLNEDDIVFIYTGKITPGKRLPLLIQAAAKLVKNHNNFKVILVGNGSLLYVEKLKQEIAGENLEDRFIWHDAVPNKELYKFYSAADVAVWPRGGSIGQREAMACGLPIIISESSMTPELVDYNNGLICQDENASDLAQQMEKLLDPGLRREMGVNSRKYIEERLNWKIIARQFLELVAR